MIIRFLGENIKSYLEEFQNGLKTLQRECPNCRDRCNKHGTYYRYVIEQGMIAVRIPIQRMYCKQCHKSHAVIPHILRPYSPYQQGVREAVLARYAGSIIRYLRMKRYISSMSSPKGYPER